MHEEQMEYISIQFGFFTIQIYFGKDENKLNKLVLCQTVTNLKIYLFKQNLLEIIYLKYIENR